MASDSFPCLRNCAIYFLKEHQRSCGQSLKFVKIGDTHECILESSGSYKQLTTKLCNVRCAAHSSINDHVTNGLV